ncbi:hypothetical protein EJ04DRAFT_485787 [Polyplosphaeria fusca]|uniref:A to I editase domain-containing protein n=1 Tax=Polyplosphaeria fusca TaxID=682080 RepID=A0A9P4V6T4_9PLEO|nr:hypothetical protein EJ04DRAFT_485787 [Polyplosphaeria fusca]
MKCLPSTKLFKAQGNVLHDWHAEIVALRAFNRFLLDELRLLLTPPCPPSHFVRQRATTERTETQPQPFTVKEDVQIHLYCSEAPCGDASMELVMDAQQDATPWTSAPPTIAPEALDNVLEGAVDDGSTATQALRGRSNFSYLGAVRLKPSRPDAPPTVSKSCTDKLALKQCTSLLSSVTASLISPQNAYLTSLVLPQSQYVETACRRAFSREGRMKGVTPQVEQPWRGSGYHFQGFDVRTTEKEFEFSRRGVSTPQKAVPSNLSAVHTPHLQETLIGGTLQGRKQFDPKGASAICRRSMWKTAIEVAVLVGLPMLLGALTKPAYGEAKRSPNLAIRKRVKDEVRCVALEGWIQNTGDDDFGSGN